MAITTRPTTLNLPLVVVVEGPAASDASGLCLLFGPWRPGSLVTFCMSDMPDDHAESFRQRPENGNLRWDMPKVCSTVCKLCVCLEKNCDNGWDYAAALQTQCAQKHWN